MAEYAPTEQSMSARLAADIAAGRFPRRSEFRLAGRVEDYAQSARVVVKTGERRTPGADPAEVDTEITFTVTVNEWPKGQTP